MPLPASFAQQGFVPGLKARTRHRLPNGKFLRAFMLSLQGPSGHGKNEFAMSCPDPGIFICLDRQYEAPLHNPAPPLSRRNDWGFKVIKMPMNHGQVKPEDQPLYLEAFLDARNSFYAALKNPDATTVVMDGDTEFYELQVLAEYGKTKQVWPQTRWSDVMFKRREILAKAWDSGKIVVFTNKVKDEYVEVLGADGLPMKDDKGESVRKKTGRQTMQGFQDTSHLVVVRLQSLFEPPTKTTAARWGVRFLKCSTNMNLVGEELWDDDCCFSTVAQMVYPDTPLEEFGL